MYAPLFMFLHTYTPIQNSFIFQFIFCNGEKNKNKKQNKQKTYATYLEVLKFPKKSLKVSSLIYFVQTVTFLCTVQGFFLGGLGGPPHPAKILPIPPI